MLRPTDGTFARSRICHQQLLPWACVRLLLSAPSVTLRLFDSQTQKKHDIPWPARIYHSSSAESQAPPLYEINEGGGGAAGRAGWVPEARRHPSEGDERGTLWSSGGGPRPRGAEARRRRASAAAKG